MLARISVQMPLMCGVAKLLPVATIVEPSCQATSTSTPRANSSTGGVGLANHVMRVGLVVAADADHAREPPRERLDRHVVRGGDDQRALEEALVGELVETGTPLAVRRREAQVDHVVALGERVAQPLEQDRAVPGEAGAEDTHAVQLAVGRELADHARTRVAVAAQVALVVRLDVQLAVLVTLDRDGGLHGADARVRVDAAVDDADANALARSSRRTPIRV